MHLCASRAFSFIDGLVAGDLQTAQEIAKLLPRQHEPRIEYEDDFLFYHCLRLILQARPPQRAHLEEVMARWRTVLAGSEDPYLDACQALSALDAGALSQSLEYLVEERRREFTRGRQDQSIDLETQLTEGRIFLKGLALLRLASMCSIETLGEYSLMPAIARPPLGRIPPPPDDWKRF
jgi:hypothetical protein